MRDADTLANRLAEIEAKLTFSEDSLDEMSRTVYRQQQQIDRLQQALRALQEIVEGAGTTEAVQPRDEIPPHY